MDELYLLSPESAEWVRRKRAEGDFVPGPQRMAGLGAGSRTAIIRCGPLIDAGLRIYSGSILQRLGPSEPWQSAGQSTIRLAELNGGPLSPGQIYLATGAGFHPSPGGEPVYWCEQGGFFDTRDVRVVTRVCPIRNSSGVLTGFTQESQLIRLPSAFVVGGRECLTDPTGCCFQPLTCPGCPPDTPVPSRGCLILTNKTGVALCLPDSIPLVYEHPSSSGPFYRFDGPAGVFGGYDYSGGSCGPTAAPSQLPYRLSILRVAIACRSDGSPGFFLGYFGFAPDEWIGPPLYLGGPLDGAAAANGACDLFSPPSGTLLLGTISHTGGAGSTYGNSSVTLYFGWGSACQVIAAPPTEDPLQPRVCPLTISVDPPSDPIQTYNAQVVIANSSQTVWQGASEGGPTGIRIVTVVFAAGVLTVSFYNSTNGALTGSTVLAGAGPWTGTITSGDFAGMTVTVSENCGGFTPPPGAEEGGSPL